MTEYSTMVVINAPAERVWNAMPHLKVWVGAYVFCVFIASLTLLHRRTRLYGRRRDRDAFDRD